MKNKIILALAAVLFVASFANAALVDYNFNMVDDGSFEIINSTFQQSGSDEYDLYVNGIQHSVPVNFNGNFITNGVLTTVNITEDIKNKTSFAWTGYDFYIAMSEDFTISNTIAPAGWSGVITQPELYTDDPLLHGDSGWIGKISFAGIIPIDIYDIGTFGYSLSFGDDCILFCTKQVPVPEPATVALLSLGSLAMLRRKKMHS